MNDAPLKQLLSSTKVGDVMNRQVMTLPASTSILDGIKTLVEHNIGGMALVSSEGNPTGSIGSNDLLEALLPLLEQPTAIEDCVELMQRSLQHAMVPYYVAIPAKTPLSMAAALMVYEFADRLLVLDEQKKIVGMIRTTDIVRWLLNASGFPPPITNALP